MRNPENAQSIIDNIKVSRGCESCGYNAHPRALGFDHIDPATKYRTRNGRVVHLSDMVTSGRYALVTILAEIAKCRVMCHNCHAVHTYDTQRA